MTASRERVRTALNHKAPDRVPVDLDSSVVTGISASAYGKLRLALGFEPKPVKVWEPFQMLGEVDTEVKEALGVDVVGLEGPTTAFRFPNVNWRPWRPFHGTEVLVSEHFVTTETAEGDTLIYPGGDENAAASGRMPKDGFYFDAIVRQDPIDWEHLDPEEWVSDTFSVYTDAYLEHLRRQADDLYRNTPFSLLGSCAGGSFGDIALVPAPGSKHPRGIRDPQDWYVGHASHPEHIRGIFELQCDIALQNLKLYKEAVGDRIDAVFVSGTDFGSQRGPFISPKMYRDLYKPFHKRLNDWIHANTNWKTFYHCCGSAVAFLDDFIDAGVDILNPVQTSAEGMDPATLKEKYGDRLVFWGGGVDTQRTLQFGSPDEVRAEVKQRLEIFGRGGGYVFNPIHNIQHGTPPENMAAMFEAVKEFRESASRP
jgi:hypothetical protein